MRALYALLLLCLLVLAGCGGGGSGPTRLRVVLDWTNRDTPGQITGRSVRASLLDANNAFVTSSIINQDQPGVQMTDLPDVPSGVYTVRLELNSLRDFGGTVTGIVEAQIRLQGTTAITVSVGDPRTGVRVSPEAATFRVNQSQRFFARAVNAAGITTFTALNDWTWSTLGGVASINSDGIAVGETAGNGSVRASSGSFAGLGSASITVTPTTATRSKWTVLVFMNAANDLSAFDQLNINQMERVASNPEVRFVVQWKQAPGSWDPDPSFNGTRRYLIRPDSSSSIASELIQDMGTNVDMGQPETLRQFLDWGRANYPADRYVVIVWNHGNGWRRAPLETHPTRAISYDDQTGNAIQTWELGSALGTYKWDILAWDASLMQMLEVAYEVRGNAQFVVGSQESPPGEGYPYDAIFGRFRDDPDAATRQLTKAFVDGMLNHPPYASRKITQSVLETSKLGALAAAVSGLGDALIAERPNLLGIVPSVRSSAQSFSPTPTRVFRDLIDVCSRLEASVGIPTSVATAAAAVRTAASDAIVWEGHNANSPGSRGVSIDFSPSSVFSSADYARLGFAADTSWNEWLAVAP